MEAVRGFVILISLLGMAISYLVHANAEGHQKRIAAWVGGISVVLFCLMMVLTFDKHGRWDPWFLYTLMGLAFLFLIVCLYRQMFPSKENGSTQQSSHSAAGHH